MDGEEDFAFRRVQVNQEGAGDDFVGNEIHTARYTLLTFLPKNLFEQFRRVANTYFLLIVILQMIPGVSPVNPIVSVVPLVFVLSVTALKEAHEDYLRHKSDSGINNSKTHRLINGRFEQCCWHEVRIGDIVQVRSNEFVPADLVLLFTTEPESVAFVETANLDGETNLKIKQALKVTSFIEFDENDRLLSPLPLMQCECELPNNRLYQFEGSLELNGEKHPLEINQLLMRGCILRNTAFATGVVVFTGMETKLMQNSTDAPSKMSRLEKLMNQAIIYIFGVLAVACLICAIGSGIYTKQEGFDAWYLQYDDHNDGHASEIGGMSYITYLILFNIMVPISLYVSLELVKISQALFMNQDLEMYHEETDTPARARTSNLGEELGQIEYVFSDKTGTLTRNVMEFRKCSIAGTSYGKGLTEIAIAAAKRRGEVVYEDEQSKTFEKGFNFDDDRLLERLNSGHQDAHHIHLFLEILSVCHTVLPEVDDLDPSILIYQAASPDEGALVTGAKCLGYRFHTRNVDSITVNHSGAEHSYEILNVLEFNSTRKRMSVVARRADGSIVLMCKGADTVIYERLAKTSAFREETLEHMEEFAKDGLRTLCISYRDISEDEYEQWVKVYHEASVALDNRGEKLDAAAEMIEHDLELVGCTAIEDKLQKGVPDAIATLAKAGVAVWVLTGDKQETAINIGFACNLLTLEQTAIVLNADTKEKCRENIQHYLEKFKPLKADDPRNKFSLVVDGKTLGFALEDDLKLEFLELGMLCQAVVCCRVSPIQKALVVLLVKETLDAVTLAIGDGANDVAMIQAAHVGVGISGQEGMQAVLASDYAIAQFRYLARLLLVHGRWSYRRISMLMNYSFYKNMAFSLVQFFFTLTNGFSGQTYVDSIYIAVFNLFFTGLPIVILAVFDKDVSASSVAKFPQLYEMGLKNTLFNGKLFLMWMAEALWAAVVLYLLPALTWGDGLTDSDGIVQGLFSAGSATGAFLVLVVNLKLALITKTWTWLNLGAIVFSIVSYALIALGLNYFSADFIYGVFGALVAHPHFWFTMIAVLIFSVLPGFVFQYCSRMYRPIPVNIVQEMEKYKKLPLTPSELEMAERGPTAPAAVSPKAARPLDKFRRAVVTVMAANLFIDGKSQPYTGSCFDHEEGWFATVSRESTVKQKTWRKKRAERVRLSQDQPSASRMSLEEIQQSLSSYAVHVPEGAEAETRQNTAANSGHGQDTAPQATPPPARPQQARSVRFEGDEAADGGARNTQGELTSVGGGGEDSDGNLSGEKAAV